MNTILVKCHMPQEWVDIPTPQGPDMQVRWGGHVGSPDASGPSEVTLEYRVKPKEGE